MDFPAENIRDRIKKFLSKEKLRDSLLVKIIIGLILVFAGIFMFPHPETMQYNYNVGSVWVDKDLIAPFAFPIYKELRDYERERQEVTRDISPVFERNESAGKASVDSFASVIRSLGRSVDVYQRWLKSHSLQDSILYNQTIANISTILSKADWNYLTRSRDSKKKDGLVLIQKLEKIVPSLLAETFNIGIIDQVKMKQTHLSLAIRKGVLEESTSYDKIYDAEEALSFIASKINTVFSEEGEQRIALRLIQDIIKPNINFNQTATNQSLQIALDNIPRTIGFVQQNERIVSKQDRITEEIKLKLDSFRRAKAEHGTSSSGWKHWMGVFLHVSVILCLFSLYLYLFRKRIFHDNGKLVMIAVLILFEMMLAYLTLILNFQEPLQYLIFIPVASMLLAIVFDSRVAFYGTVTIAFMVAGIRSNDYVIGLSSIVAGILAAYTVRDIRDRTQIFWSMIYIAIGYTISILALSFEQLEEMSKIFTDISFALVNSVVSPVLTYGLLIFFERAFKVTTDFTFVELSDMNHPLLRELSEKAPGTFHHSVTIGNIAEAAAEAIGANSMLAKVGGYYHDIGKTLKPEYFSENQIGSHSRHNRLKPRMSALIISSHVREGVELGREKGLPEIVLDFIPQHHGTTRISFFYDKALKQAAKKPQKDEIREEDFLYPGPKPQTKETGIVMLADAVEAATRTLGELTPQRLESAIDNMIKHRFMDGELDECELTLRDLTKIKEAFLKMMLGIHHPRVKYPEEQLSALILPAEASLEQTQEKLIPDTANENIKEQLPGQKQDFGPMPEQNNNQSLNGECSSDASIQERKNP